MKKTYSKPTAEKLAFKYREQIVAASGDGGDSGNQWEEVFKELLEGLGVCQYIPGL